MAGLNSIKPCSRHCLPPPQPKNLELICILFILSILPSCRAFGLSLFAAHVTPLGLDAERPSRAWFRCRLAGRTKFRLASST